jgi:hypothetical protein
MKYLCLVYFQEKTLEALSEKKHHALTCESLDHDDELRRRGNFIVAQALQPVRTAIAVRVRNNRISVTDGPSPRRRNSWAASSSSSPPI